VVEATQAGSVVQMSTTDVAATVSALAARGALEGLSVRGASLEDVFLAHAGRTLSDAVNGNGAGNGPGGQAAVPS